MNPYGGIYSEQPKKRSAWPIVGVGVGLMSSSVPFCIASNKNAGKALATENGETIGVRPYFQLKGRSNGLAFSYHF